ncbi:MAG: CooT family nickel-binding protein [Desulfobulbaceae bacterium]|nr:CooT family nickel-binding protein [Desulfobulbaceae bacterium]HIJ79024.1 CooT family nickel-binding protein [Deltaproteobacteria bacterium]
MCQMSIVLAGESGDETILENASLLEVTDKGILASTLFDEPRLIEKAMVQKIDFLNGKVTLIKTGKENP